MNWQKILTFDKLEAPVKKHVKKVYSTLAIAMLAATAGAYIHMFTNLMQAGLLTVLGSLGMLALLSFTPHNSKNEGKRLAYLMGFAALTGMGLGPLLDMAIRIEPSIVPTALLGTFVIFGCFSISALLCDNRQWLYLGGFLMSGLSWMLMLTLMNIFFRSQLLFQVELYLGLALMCGFVLYDTQMVVEKRRRGDDDYIWHCVDLFIDMVNIFRRLLIILSSREDNKKKRSN